VLIPSPRRRRRPTRFYGKSKAIAAAVTFVVLYVGLRIFAPEVFDWGAKFRQRAVPVQDAFRSKMSGVVVEPAGLVEEVLSDSLPPDGGALQRFRLRDASGHPVTVLRDPAAGRLRLAPGDSVAVRGFYAWNPAGGLVHTTHADSASAFEGWVRVRD
jgi:hypothetical protein